MSVEIQPGAIVCKDAVLKGTHLITIQDKCVLHPHCRIIALHGDIVIESGTIIEEFVDIINKLVEAFRDTKDLL
jgi:acetyltransferase-like isoleucine patch superfamily enzyme